MAAGQKQVEPAEGVLDRELDDLPAELRWREWLRRIEAVLFASAEPVSRDMLARVVGQGASVDLLLDDLRAELAAIAWHQPITRSGLAALFGGKVSRDALAHLRARELIAPGPRSPEPGAPQSFVTTEGFLDLFGLEELQDLPDLSASPEGVSKYPGAAFGWPVGEEEA